MTSRFMKGIKLLSVILIINLIIMAATPCMCIASGNDIIIKTASDFAEFAKNCRLDSWSSGKHIVLAADIDLSKSDFSPVATFGGSFDGCGYTISGVNLKKGGTNIALFRYLRNGAEIKNLTVKAKVTPTGTKENIGGICASNSGTIQNCSFDGTIKGNACIGGISAIVNKDGKIVSCQANGKILGDNCVGGICGRNEGFITSCENYAEVNTEYEEKSTSISDFDINPSALMEDASEINVTQKLLTHTDSGGIAGYSGGIIEGCLNYAKVGYNHVGYNVGGICGRQSGYIVGCENHGDITGRKDVGGIVGQAEPYLLLQLSEHSIASIRSEINKMQSMADKFISDTDQTGSDFEKYCLDISNHAKSAREYSENMLNSAEDYADDSIAKINAETAKLSNTLDRLQSPLDSIISGCDNLVSACNRLEETTDEIELELPSLSAGDNALLKKAVKSLEQSSLHLSKASQYAKTALFDFRTAVKVENEDEVKTALKNLEQALLDMINAQTELSEAIQTISGLVKNGDLSEIISNREELISGLDKIITSVKGQSDALEKIVNAVDIVKKNTTVNYSIVKTALANIENMIDEFTKCTYSLGRALGYISDILETDADFFGIDYSDESNNLKQLQQDIKKCVDLLCYAVYDIQDAVLEMRDILSDFTKDGPLKFTQISEDFKENSSSLLSSLADISNDLTTLRACVSDGRKKLSDDASMLSAQLNVIMNMMLDEIEDLTSGESYDFSKKFIDISEENIQNSKQGKVDACRNFAHITGERSVGGITGAMSCEYTKDPEDDIERPKTLNFSYNTKALVTNCINDGDVTGNKDKIGGIAGSAELGIIYQCENYADIFAEPAAYAGGIVGKSDAMIRKSCSKCKVSAKQYVGGIAGAAERIHSCLGNVTVTGDEYLGEICGKCETKQGIYQNYFLDNGVGAIDEISYIGIAEPKTYQQITKISGVPKRFISFTVSFKVDGNVIDEQEVPYAFQTQRIHLPQIPEKNGFFGKWDKFETDYVTTDIDIECRYSPYITVLSSEEKNKSGKLSVCLAEGNFTDDAVLHMLKANELPPEKADKNAKVYKVTIKNAESEKDGVTLRLLNEENRKADVWCKSNGKWIKLDTKNRGKYVITKVDDSTSIICISYGKPLRAWLYILLLAIAILLLGTAAFYIRKTKQRAPSF